MTPDVDLQLSVVIKALRDVVAPALAAENRMAIEQLQLAIATLGMVQARLPLLHAATRAELANAIGLAEAVRRADDQSRLDEAIAAGKAALDDPTAPIDRLEACRTALLAGASSLVREAAEPARQRAIARAVVTASKPQCDLARALGLAAGFETDPAEAQALEKVLVELKAPA